MNAEINKIQNRLNRESQWNKKLIKSWFFKKSNKIDKLLAMLKESQYTNY